MASYLDKYDYEREGLPSIYKNSYNERKVMFEDSGLGLHKYRSRSPTVRSKSPRCRSKSPILRSKSPTSYRCKSPSSLRSRSPTSGFYTISGPRPPSPTCQNRRVLSEVKTF